VVFARGEAATAAGAEAQHLGTGRAMVIAGEAERDLAAAVTAEIDVVRIS
jgi:hypothetical protein